MAERRARQAWHFSVQWTQRAWLGPGLVQGSRSPRCRSFRGLGSADSTSDARLTSLTFAGDHSTFECLDRPRSPQLAATEAINVLIFSAKDRCIAAHQTPENDGSSSSAEKSHHLACKMQLSPNYDSSDNNLLCDRLHSTPGTDVTAHEPCRALYLQALHALSLPSQDAALHNIPVS